MTLSAGRVEITSVRHGLNVLDLSELRREAGRQFDADVVDALAIVLEREPVEPVPTPATATRT